ncbi:alkaline phosphatase D family protein [Amycolatopsis coloradensis]|uniref:alkaline phosphatase D family protein n=1 Tax=Amycolatopsis coloradensis TaxID=76021 RepID=UPI001FCA3ED6|nr:alkaline phosphatase D family protein [Amycolatopsis coloradensis]
MGDYLDEGNPNPAGDLRPSVPSHELITLSDYRRRHAMYKTDEHPRRLHARHPVVATWDDHEAADNASPSHDPGTEVRSYRTRQPGPVADPAGTILGADQRQWFLDGLARGTASWNVVGNSVMVTPIKVPALPTREKLALADLLDGQPTTANTDQWDGCTADRRRVLDAIAPQGRGNTVFLTGDVPSSWANDGPRDGTSVAVEFVCPSVPSDNIDEQLGVPPRTGSLEVEAAIRALNPHVRFVELDSHAPASSKCPRTPSG